MTSSLAFSIILPAYQRPRRLQQCLDALITQDYAPEQMEIIVIDDGSHPPLKDVVVPYTRRHNVRYLRQTNAGPAQARNLGVQMAQYPFLAFTDDDCAPKNNWLSTFATQLAQNPNSMVGGYTRNGLLRNPYSITSQLLIDYLYHHFNRSESRAGFFTSNNFAVSADLFWQVGGFDETMPLAAGEDREFCDRWLESGFGMIYLPRAVIFHAHKLGIRSFWRQHFNYGRGAWHYRALRSQRTATAVQLESPKFYWRLIRFPLTMGRDIRAYILTGMLGLTQAINATGFFYERLVGQRKRKSS